MGTRGQSSMLEQSRASRMKSKMAPRQAAGYRGQKPYRRPRERAEKKPPRGSRSQG